jgi:hypothetical protein
MALFFRQLGNSVEELHAGHEAFDDPVFANSLAIVGQSPSVECTDLLLGLLRCIFGHTAFTGHTPFARQLFGSLRAHIQFPFSKVMDEPFITLVGNCCEPAAGVNGGMVEWWNGSNSDVSELFRAVRGSPDPALSATGLPLQREPGVSGWS